MIPAHVTRMSSDPDAAAASTAASTSARFVTSQATARPPISRAVSCAAPSSKSATTTDAPSDASRRAVAAPIPLAPPVTRAAFPSNLPMRATIYGAGMEFRDVLARRRMHRAFLPDPLPVEQIERVVGVIRRAPSGGFSQGGSIVVVTDEPKRLEIARAFGDEHYSRNGRNYIADAPALLVISANEALYHARYNEADKLAATGGTEISWPVPYWYVDAGALMMLVLLAAIDEGLASAFIGHPDQKQIFDALLGLPQDVVPIGLALIGKPGEDPPSSSRLKEMQRAQGDLLHWQRW